MHPWHEDDEFCAELEPQLFDEARLEAAPDEATSVSAAKDSLPKGPSRKNCRLPTGRYGSEVHSAELFPRGGFIATNLGTGSRAVVRFFNKRGTAEQWIGEGKPAVNITRLSCHRFRSNQVRLWLT